LKDIHCHILPGIDDGPRNLQDALKMARMAVKDGVHTIVATPHCYDNVYDCQRFDIPTLCANFNDSLRTEKIALTVVPGAEIRLCPELISLIDSKQIVADRKNASPLLLELPEIFIPDAVKKTIRMLRERDVRCIIAHPERNSFILSKNELLTGSLFADTKLQITAGSLLGNFGKNSQLLARYILKMSNCSHIGSDAHNTHQRKPVLAKAVKYAARTIGQKTAETMVGKGK